MKKWIFSFIFLLIPSLCFGFSGWIEGSYFPVNDEHETPLTVEGYVEYGEKIFCFSGAKFNFTSTVPDRVRYDRTYVTNLDCGAGYVSQFDAGIGYRIDNIDLKFLYRCQREFNGYEGDWTGIQVRWTFK